MATQESVYNVTTTPETKPKKWFNVPNGHLSTPRFFIKFAEVLLSFVAFILEEVVTSCVRCGSLYFFEFVSCTAFLFTVLLLVLLSTQLHSRVGIDCWPTVDFGYTIVIFLFFLIASIVFVADNGGTGLECTAVVFGFLSTLAFLVDVVMILRTKGCPCRNRDRPVTDNGDANQVPAEESVRLNTTE